MPDLLQRDFSTGVASAHWCADVIHLPVAGRWTYLATVIDIGPAAAYFLKLRGAHQAGYPLASDAHAEVLA